MFRWYLIGIALLALLSLAGGAKYLYDQNQSLKTEKAILEAQNAQITKTANRFANKPKSDDDVTDELCRRARGAESRDNKTNRKLPVRPCP